ncbi:MULTISPECIES: phosphatase PAP2 family protein [Metabacillus]|uniref:Phosphatase PAP2 family protein n=1 Tax=Metabacillus hrfriensis TaxID=3048891 RepID=A0ACD4R626_9BACI|nr:MULTISPECIES: phosphatase PAP2 family protein [Metabacillus]UAL50446.1 phosphatase PAP2 family protein [Metabacillus dongyingensis]USK26704.1 phosphatase PAP2 family protein [Bacillus sp. CMF21]WHZ55926.1 phosphatase PAP2 family protein [Metabacillus sp. CT-WN-B3]
MSKAALIKIRGLTGLFIFPILGLIYEYLNEKSANAVNISSPLDSYIPFAPIFIIPYVIWYVYMFGFLLYFWWKNPSVYWKSILAITAGEIVCFIIYFYFQTTVPRPQLMGDSFLVQLVSLIYSSDQPYNCFPSIHVLTTMIIMLSVNRIEDSGKMMNYVTQVTGILIILSTLFVKQHVIYDVLSSVILSAGLWMILFERKAVAAKLENIKNTRKKSGLSKGLPF